MHCLSFKTKDLQCTLPHALEAFSHPTCLCIAGSPIKVSNYAFIGLQNVTTGVERSLRAFSDAKQEQHASI